MSNPTVAAVMLANGRPDMVRRAVKSFRAQTYESKELVVFDNGGGLAPCGTGAHIFAASAFGGSSIGKLRNAANHACTGADIICHFDSDDWSHPNRIAEQVALLQSTGAECVGYNEMLFWADAPQVHFVGMTPAGVSCACGNRYPRTYGRCNKCETYPPDAEAWLYRAGGCKPLATNYAIGTSMCYWRKTWEQFPFPDHSPGCDDLYWSAGDEKKGRRAVKIEAISAYPGNNSGIARPRMIASIHAGNTVAKIDSTSKGGKEVWTRVPEWDAYCREAMKL